MRLYDRVTDRRAPPPIGGLRPLRTVERERPTIAHHAVHETREAAATRTDRHPEHDVARRSLFQLALEAPPPRPGYVQRWISDGSQPNATKAEKLNWVAKQKQGWAFRDPETVPHDLRAVYPSTKLGSGQDVICVASMVLAEMNVEVAHERQMAVDERIQHNRRAVIPSTEEMVRAGQGRGVFGPLQVEDRDRSYRGRQAPTMVG